MRRSHVAVCLVVACSFPMLVSAGTIRDDRDPQSYLNLAAQPQYANVGRIDSQTTTGDLIGSGTLIAPQFVLTAGHLVDHLASLQFSLDGANYTATHWIANPNWNGDLTAGYDLAVVELNVAASGVVPAVRYDGSSELNSVGTFVGFGRTGTGLSGATNFDGFARAGTNVLDGFYDNNPRILAADFDSPQSISASSQGSSTPTNLEYMIAAGDSGGGLFIDTAAGPRLAGVHSFGAAFDGRFNASYGDVSGDIRVSLFNSWIDQAIGSLTALSGSGLPMIAVPEPSSWRLACFAGLVAWLGLWRRRRLL
ncbi:MAG: trypsin-like serine protease [Planctomycetia bacterium]|nr:trypsin-like serine protease [Planctomycetia bacterium]